jgi:ABC-type lipoprotein release transport system permease subunit
VRAGAVWATLGSEVRRHRGAFAIAVLLAGLAGGATLTAAAGARRSDTAYERFLEWSGPIDFGAGGALGTDAELAADLVAIERAPFVEAVAHVPAADLQVRDEQGELLQPFQVRVIGDRDDVLADGPIGKEKVLRGRHARPEAADEATVSFATAERLGVDAGDDLELYPYDGDPIEVRVTGIVARTGEFPNVSGSATGSVALTSGFVRAHPDLFQPGNDGLIVRVRDGVPQAELERWATEHVHATHIEATEVGTASTMRTIHIETVALWAVAAVLALTFLVLVGQVLLRHAANRSDDVAVLSTLGLTRGYVLLLGASRGAAIGGVGAVAAVAVAILASPMTPVGLGRLAEPHPGVRVDGPVLIAGALLIWATTTVLGALTAQRAAAWATRRSRRASRVVPLPRLPVVALAGLHLLLRPARRREARVARVTVASLCFVIAAAVAVLVTLSSLSNLQSHAALAGATWDGVVEPNTSDGGPAAADQLEQARATLAKLPGVEATAAGGWSPAYAGDDMLMLQVFGDGEIVPAIAAGRAPRGAGEVALGAEEMERLGVGIGDEIALAGEPGAEPVRLRVVGRSVLVSPIFAGSAPGDNGATTTATMRALGLERLGVSGVLVRFAPDRNVNRALADAVEAIGGGFAFSARDRTIIDGIDRVRTVPATLIAILAALGTIGLVHVLLMSTRRRRGDIAVLRALGFTRRQVRSMVGVYGTGVAALALIVGIPLGVAAGRVGWDAIADYLRVVPQPTTPAWLLWVVVTAVFAAAVATIVPTGHRAVRVAPAEVLRGEPV